MTHAFACLLAAASAAESPAGFTPLFNGRDLTDRQAATTGYEAVHGELRSMPGVGGNLLTVGEYGDFVLRFEFRLTPGVNNGLAIRMPPKGNAAFEGMEFQILDDGHFRNIRLKPLGSAVSQ